MNQFNVTVKLAVRADSAINARSTVEGIVNHGIQEYGNVLVSGEVTGVEPIRLYTQAEFDAAVAAAISNVS